MKKRLFSFLIMMVLCLTGCSDTEETQKQEIAEAFENIGVAHETVVRNILSKKWNVRGSETTYEFTKEGTGHVSGEAFTYESGFDENNQIMVKMMMGESGEICCYHVYSDDTGHGLVFESASDGKEIQLINADVLFLDFTDERAASLVGEWADKSDNRYIFNDDFSMLIKGKKSDTEGTYSVVIKEEQLLLTLVFEGNALEYAFELSENGNSVNLKVQGTDAVHTWVRKS